MGRLSQAVIRAYESGANRRTTYHGSRSAHMFNSRKNKAASRIVKAIRQSRWRRSRAKTPYGPRAWAAKTSKYGTYARIAQNKWRERFTRKYATTAYKRHPKLAPNYTW